MQLRLDQEAAPGLAGPATWSSLPLVVSRLVGDRLSARYPRAATVRACGLLTAAGVAVAVLAPAAWIALAGWAPMGLAVALLAPTVLSAAPDATRAGGHHEDGSRSSAAAIPAPVAITAVTMIGNLCFFTSPPLIGALAEYVDLSHALTLVAVAGLVVALLAPWAPAGPAGQTPPGSWTSPAKSEESAWSAHSRTPT